MERSRNQNEQRKAQFDERARQAKKLGDIALSIIDAALSDNVILLGGRPEQKTEPPAGA